MHRIFPGILLVILAAGIRPARGQHMLKLAPAESGQAAELKRLSGDFGIKESYADSAAAARTLRSFLNELHAGGYLAASVDSLSHAPGVTEAYISPGQPYRWIRLSGSLVDEGILREAGFRDRQYRGRMVSLRSLSGIQERLLSWCDRNGYPFAQVSFDSLAVEGAGLSARLILEPGHRFLVDSVIVRGSSRLSPVYLYNHLSVKPGKVYNESLIKKIPNRIRELPMVTEVRPLGVSFHESSATLYLYLDNKKASQLDGVVGILPDNSGNGKVHVTGDVHLKLFSAFGYGELFDLNWKQPLPKTQDLRVQFSYPFLFSTPLGLDLGLSIYKKDTTYLELNRSVGFRFAMTGGNHVKAFYNNRKSTLLNTEAFENSAVLPPFADIRVNSYGLGLHSEKLDYRLNPRSGYAADVTGTVGRKNIQRNVRLKLVDYDSLKLNSTQYTAHLTADYFLPVFARNVVDLGAQAGLLYGDETFQNELYRIGGLKTLRGFDEESILASAYLIWKAEFRYILEENSYLFLFINGAWYERKQRDYYIRDTPTGFGAGITFETGLGIFSLNYALGQEFGNPILLRAGKVHFGLVNYF